VETFDGVGEAEPPKPAAIDILTITNKIETLTIMQDPSKTTWSRGLAPVSTPRHSIERLESLQSPNSTAWKPTDVDPPVLYHRSSSIEVVDQEEIRQIEEECAIKEEDEEEDDEE